MFSPSEAILSPPRLLPSQTAHGAGHSALPETLSSLAQDTQLLEQTRYSSAGGRPPALASAWGGEGGGGTPILHCPGRRWNKRPSHRLSVTVVFVTCLCYLSESSWAPWAHWGWDAVMQPGYQEVPGMGCAAAAVIPIAPSLASAQQSLWVRNQQSERCGPEESCAGCATAAKISLWLR